MKKLMFLNKLKSLSLGCDDIFKKAGMESIKYHYAVSAVYQSVDLLLKENNLDALKKYLERI